MATAGPKLCAPSRRPHSVAPPISISAEGSFSSARAAPAVNSSVAINPIVPHLIIRPQPWSLPTLRRFHHIRDFSQLGSWRARLLWRSRKAKILSKLSIGLVAEEGLEPPTHGL